MIEFVKKQYLKIKEPIAFISSVITIVVVFIDGNKIFRYILAGIVLIYLLMVCSYIVKTVFDTNKAKNALERKYSVQNRELAVEMHKFFHNLRDYSSSLYSLNILTLNDVKDRCIHICNYIELIYNQLFKEYLGDDKISVCIKIIKNDSIFDADYNNWEMLTIARSNTTDQKRNRIDDAPVEICENTDFQVIIDNKFEDDLLAFADMSNIEQDFLRTYKMEYRNSRGDKFLEYYRSTIVVPIKIDGKYVSKELSERIGDLKGKSLILGFICIDSMKIFKSIDEKDIFKIGIEYAKAIADSLYLLFEKVLICCIENDTINKVN